MGTRYEDQPSEHWAGPESLDPTPVWKQYVLIAVLLLVALVAIVVVSVAALAPQLATPPALVAGDRLVLWASDVPAVAAPATFVGPPLVGDDRGFYLVQPAKGAVVALRARWSPRLGDAECRVVAYPGRAGPYFGVTDCAAFPPSPDNPLFDERGAPANATATRGLDRYLVSVSGDRIIVNLSRVIEPSERTSAPVPTGIPQPQQRP